MRTIVLLFTLSFDTIIVPIHRRRYVSILATTLIVGQAGVVELFDSSLYSSEVVTIAALIAKRPHEDTGVVAHPANVVLRAFHHRVLELRHGRQTPVSVTLYVSLCQHIHTIFIAEVVENRIVGIVRGADGIDIQTFHAENILFYLLWGDGTTVDRREVVTVDAMKHHTLAVDEQSTIFTNAHLAEAHLAASPIDHVAVLVLQRYHQVIKIRLLGTPQLWSCDFDSHTHAGCHVFAGLCKHFAIAHDTGLHLAAADGIDIRQLHLHVAPATSECCIEVGIEEEVANLTLRCRPQETAAVNTCQSPVVLTLQE